jgi:hypothetical protein
MALITCPHCQHHPVYDQAEACPKCGGPIRQAAPSPPKTADGPAAHDERQRLLIEVGNKHGNFAVFGLSSDPQYTDYPGASVRVGDCALLGELAKVAAEWLEEIKISDTKANARMVRALRQFPKLKSLKFELTAHLDDEAFLEISRCTSLRSLSFSDLKGRVTITGYALLTKLTNLELLRIPMLSHLGGRQMGYDERKALLKHLQQQLPNTVIK